MNSCLIIGHPGHELRVLKFIEIFKPMVFILTDGSGSNGISRAQRSRQTLLDLGCPYVKCFFSDKQMYEMILRKEYNKFIDIKDKIHNEIYLYDPEIIIGDSCEGFNPVHDLCRYIINSIVKSANRSSNSIKNYDFLLTKYPTWESNNHPNITISLNESDKFKRNTIIENYPEIKYEIDQAKKSIQQYGENIFDFECIREVKNHEYKNWKEEKPYYETYGIQKLQEKKYSEIITFEHVIDIANRLNA